MLFENQEKISLFNDILQFNLFFIIVDLILIFHFFYMWYQSYKKTSWKIDYWNITLLQIFFLPVLLQYPFCASIWNVFATGESYIFIGKFVDSAFFISILGYIFLWIGGSICTKFFEGSASRNFNIFEKIVLTNIRREFGINVMFYLVCIGVGVIILVQIQTGFLFNPRLFFLQNPQYRSIFNFISVAISVCGTYMTIRVIMYRSKKEKILIGLILILSIFMGARALVMGIVINFAILFSYYYFENVKLKKYMIIGIVTVICAWGLSVLREGDLDAYNYQKIMFDVPMFLFYGNSFSDLRDFAWILSCFDEKYLYGNSFIAGILSFIPRTFSAFREEWSIGVYTATLLGFDPSIHPGLRSGIFGETFLNFGYVGVICWGLITGYFLRYSDLMIKWLILKEKDLIKGYVKTLIFSLIWSSFLNTSGFWSIYSFVVINIVLLFLNIIHLKLSSSTKRA